MFVRSMMMMSLLMTQAADPVGGGGGGGGAAPPLPPAAAPPTPSTAHLAGEAARLAAVQPPVLTTHQTHGAQALEAAEQRARAAEAREAQLRQQQAAQQTDLQRLQSSVDLLTRSQQEAQTRAYQADLARYRIEVITAYQGQIIEDMVSGSTPQEITTSAQRAHQEFVRIVTATQQVERARLAPPGGTPAMPAPPVPVVQAPAYVPPMGAAGGFPTPVAAPGMAGQQQGPNVQQLTSEQAVRSGQYAQHRQAIMSQMMGGQTPSVQQPQFGQYAPPVPPQFHGVPHTNLPGGCCAAEPRSTGRGGAASGSTIRSSDPDRGATSAGSTECGGCDGGDCESSGGDFSGSGGPRGSTGDRGTDGTGFSTGSVQQSFCTDTTGR